MITVEYDWAEGYLAENGFLRPIVPVALYRGSSGPIDTTALVDSGADYAIFDAAFARLLGIEDLTQGIEQPLTGIAGQRVVGYRHTVGLKVGLSRPFRSSIVFVEDLKLHNLLGRRYVFDRMLVGFDERAARMYFRIL